MELVDFVQHAVPGLSDWKHADKIRFFAWYIHVHQGQAQFTPADIRRCYDTLHLDKPASIDTFIRAMVERSPRETLKNGSGYRLEARVRSVFDNKYGQRASTLLVDNLLSDLPTRVPNLTERKYLDETLRCFRAGAFRGTIIMAWNLAYSHLCTHVFTKRLSDFNAALPRVHPRLTPVAQQEDFAEMKESQVIQACRTANITSKNMGQILQEKLARRNMAAHPSEVEIDRLTAEETIKSLVENVVLKLE